MVCGCWPAQNLETVFWLESDRMANLNINTRSLEVQRKVVVEEFKETCLNQPYGDVWHHLVGLAYEVHPYRWPTIGLTPEHVESATLTDVQDFFHNYYHPSTEQCRPRSRGQCDAGACTRVGRKMVW